MSIWKSSISSPVRKPVWGELTILRARDHQNESTEVCQHLGAMCRTAAQGCLPYPFPDRFDHGRLVGEFACCQFGVDQFTIGRQLETATFGGDQPQLCDGHFVLGEQFGTQTERLWLVASHRAVFQFQFHDFTPRCDNAIVGVKVQPDQPPARKHVRPGYYHRPPSC